MEKTELTTEPTLPDLSHWTLPDDQPPAIVQVNWLSNTIVLSTIILAHILLFWLVARLGWSRSPIPPAEFPAEQAITSFLYQPPILQPMTSHSASVPTVSSGTETEAIKEPDETKSMDEANSMTDPKLNSTTSEHMESESPSSEVPASQPVTETEKTGLGQDSIQPSTSDILSGDSTLMNKALQHWQQQQPDPAMQHYKAQQESNNGSGIGKSPSQNMTADPSVQVLYKDPTSGLHLIRTSKGCVLADPSLQGFEQLVKLRTVPCGSNPTEQYYRETMQKWLNR